MGTGMIDLLSALGLVGPDLFLTLAKLAGAVCVISFIADQYFEYEEDWQ